MLLDPERMCVEAAQKNVSVPRSGRGSGIRPGTMYAPGDHMNRFPELCVFIENLMFRYVAATQSTFLLSGSDSSDGPEKLSLVQLDEPPL